MPEQVHIAVRYTGIRLIGELCEWLNKHPVFIGNLIVLSYQNFLQFIDRFFSRKIKDSALNFVCLGFNNPQLCQVAANTMLSICTQCQQHMVNHLETLIGIVLSVDNIEMPGDASMELLKGAIVILCNLPSNEITAPLLKICNIQLEGLKKALNNEIKSDSFKSLPLYWLDRFTAIFRLV